MWTSAWPAASRVGQPAEIALRSEPGRRYPGHVARIEIQSDAVNEERLVEVAFDKIPRDIHLAEQAEVVITTGSLDRAVLVPQTAVSDLHAGHGTVWTVEDGKLAQARRDSRCRAAGRTAADHRSAAGGHPDRRLASFGLACRARRGDRGWRIEMNLALRDVRHNALRFALTALGLGLLFGMVISMTGIYEGALDDALRLPRAASPDLWVVQPRTHGPFAEAVADTTRHARPDPPYSWRGRGRRGDIPDGADRGRWQAAAHVHRGLRAGTIRAGRNIWSTGADITASHYQIVADSSSGLRLGQQVPLGPLRQTYTVVGLTSGMVTSAGDPVAWVTLLDAQSLQFAVPPALERREQAAGRPAPQTGDINAVLVRLAPGVPAAAVAAEIERWKHLAAVSQAEQENFLTEFVIDKMQRQLGMFMAILITVSAVILALIIYTLTMDKLRSIATLKLIGAPDRVIVGLILQQAMVLGVAAFVFGLGLILAVKDHFPRRVMLEPRDVAVVFAIVLVVCLLASILGVRTALKVDATKALAG